jgi:hypothetical protein
MKRFWAAGSISDRKKMCRTHVPHVLNLTLDRGVWSAPSPSCFIPKETDPWVFAEQEARAGQHTLEK